MQIKNAGVAFFIASADADCFAQARLLRDVRKDERDAFFFIVSGARKTDSDLEQCAVVELKIEWMGRKRVYVIKSARPMNWGRLRKIELVCVKPRS